MLSSTNFWMGLAGLIYLVAGVFVLRKEISAARGWDKLITLGPCLHRRSPRCIRARAFPRPRVCPEYGPVVDAGAPCSGLILSDARCSQQLTSLTVRKFVRLSSTLLGLMFFLFVCMIYIPCCAQASHRSIRVDLRAKRSLFCRRRMGSRRTA